MLTSREQEVLSLLRKDPMLSQQAIADALGITRSAAAGHLMNATKKGLIKGRGYVLSDAPFVSIVGGANIDIHGRSSADLRRRDSNPGEVTTSAGGVARNVAESLCRLGVDARLITAIGNDQHGRVLQSLSRDAGIDMQYTHEIAAAPTSTYISVLDNTGDMQVAIADMSVIDHLTADRLRSQQAMLQQSALIVVDANLSEDTLRWLAGVAGSIPLFADTVSTAKALRLRPVLASIHTLKANAAEAEALTGMPANSIKQLRRLAGSLHAAGVQRVFITRAERGVFFSTPENSAMQKPLRKRHVRNSGGAGDAFLAGLAYAWLKGWRQPRSLEFALAAADLTLSHAATSHPDLSLAAVLQAMEAS